MNSLLFSSDRGCQQISRNAGFKFYGKTIDVNFIPSSKWIDSFLKRLGNDSEDDAVDEKVTSRPTRHRTATVKTVSAELNDFEMDHYFELVAKDEMRVVRHLEMKLFEFIERSSDRIMLSELVYREAKKHSHIFEVSPVWVSEFLDLHRGFIHENSKRCRRPPSPMELVDEFRTLSPPLLHDSRGFTSPVPLHEDERYYRREMDDPERYGIRPDMFMTKDGEYFFHGDPVKRKRIFDAFRNKSYSIHQWMDDCLDESD